VRSNGRRTALLAVLFSSIAGISACGEDSSNHSDTSPTVITQAPAVDACSLFTHSDAETVLRQSPSPTSAELQSPFSVCTYSVQDGKSTASVRVNQSSFTTGSFETLVSRKLVGDPKPEVVPVPELGDAAYYITGAVNEMAVLKGETVFLFSAATADPRADSERGARLVLDHIK